MGKEVNAFQVSAEQTEVSRRDLKSEQKHSKLNFWVERTDMS